MPHFFLPINWFLAPTVILLALLITTALMFWAVPNLKFPSYSTSLTIESKAWSLVSESMLFSMYCTFVFQTKSFMKWKE